MKNKLITIILISLMGILAMTAQATAAENPWPMFQGDAQHTGRSPYIGPETPTLKWSYETVGRINASPVIGADNTIYVGSHDCNHPADQKFYAINFDGSLKWSFDLGLSVMRSAAIGSDGTIVIYVGEYDCGCFGYPKFYAFNTDGSIKWSFAPGGTRGGVASQPIIGDDGTVYLGFGSRLYAINPDGSIKWEFVASTWIFSSPSISSDGTIYVGCNNRNLYAVNPDGTLKWNFTTSGQVRSSPSIGSDGTIYVGSHDNKFYAINPDGTLKWNFTTNGMITSSSAIGEDGVIYFGSWDNYLYALYPDGSLKWKFDVGVMVYSSPSIDSEGTIYFGSWDYNIYAIKSDGTLKWNYTTGGAMSSPAIGADGTIYIGSCDRKLYAIGHGIVNQAPTFSNLDQYKSDGITTIDEKATTIESTVVFKATLSDSDNDRIKLQVEIKEYEQDFDEQNIIESDLVDSGNEAIITRFGLILGQYKWRARAVDERGAVSGDWQEFGTDENVDFEVKLVPLYTQIISQYPSIGETDRWDNKQYGDGNYDCVNWETGISDISSCGCAITSMVMLGRYYGIDIGTDGSNVDPGNINTWLTDNYGYVPKIGLIWNKASEYLGLTEDGVKKTRLSFDYYNQAFDSPTIQDYLVSAKPIVAFKNGHYFVVDGKLAHTYNIKDPYWYNTKTLNESKDLNNDIQDYNNYFEKANLFSYLEIPRKISASMNIYLASPAELLITDPRGRRLGKDPVSDISYNEIPESIYTTESPIMISDDPPGSEDIHKVKAIYIPFPIDGKYDIQVIGTGTGSYAISSLIYNEAGNSTSTIFEGVTNAGVISEYVVSLDSELPEVERVITISNIIEDVEISYELGWIAEGFVKDMLIAKLKIAQRLEQDKEERLQHFDGLIESAENPKVKEMLEKAKEEYEKMMNKLITRILEEFIRRVEFYTERGYITGQCLRLLVDDAQYVIEHL